MNASVTRRNEETRRRLIAAASELFAERGFHGTKIRDITARARVNLAASNYHYGSKKDLYLEVLREQFRAIRSVLARRGAMRPEAELRTLSRAQLVALLRARIRTMLDVLIGPRAGLHATLMLREMSDPSEALPAIVEEFIRPMKSEMEKIVSRLEPTLDRQQVESCALSIVGQAQFYRFALPALLKIMRRSAYPREFSRTLADFITQFSLGGLAALTAERRSHGY